MILLAAPFSLTSLLPPAVASSLEGRREAPSAMATVGSSGNQLLISDIRYSLVLAPLSSLSRAIFSFLLACFVFSPARLNWD